jgi:hypothetical protein
MPFGKIVGRVGPNNRVILKRPMYKKKAVQVKKLARQVRAMKPEVKYFDQALNFLLATNTAAVNLQKLFDIRQGVTVNERLGARIRATTIQMRYEIFNTGPLSTSAFIRIAIVFDKNPNQALADISDIWDPDITPFGDINLRNREYRKRFKIIYDKIFTIGDPGLSATFPAALPQGGNDRCLKNFKMFRKQNEKIVYRENSPAGTIGQTNQGAYYLATWCSLDMQCQMSANLRLTYTDD